MAKQVEAEIKTSTGTVITLKGTAEEVSKVAALFAGGAGHAAAVGTAAQAGGGTVPQGSLAGVAEKDPEGEVHIVVADLKARSALDAAKRLTYITLFARRQLLNEHVTKRSALTSVLEGYGLNDGNTRNLISKDRALVKRGRNLSLSAAAIPQVKKYITEVNDSAITGKWIPGKPRKRRKPGKSADKTKK